MTTPLQTSPINGAPYKQRAEDDSKNVHVNLAVNTAPSDFGRNNDVLQNQTAHAVESVKEDTKSMFSSVVETSKSYFRSFFPEIYEEEAVSASISPGKPQPTILQKPVLEMPGHHVQSSTQNIYQKSKGVPNDVMPLTKAPGSEAAMMKAIYTAMGTQAKLREESTRTNQTLIEQKGEKQKRLLDEYTRFKDRADERQESSEILGWTGFGAGLLAGIFTIGGIIATVATGGGALPIVLGVGAGIAGVAAGGTEIAGGVLKYQSQLDRGEMFRTKQEKDLISNSTQTILQDMESNDNSIASVWSKIAQILRNRPNLFR